MNKENRNANAPQPESLVEVRRGSITESRHRGHVIAVNADGQTVARLGQPEKLLTYLRSSAKPIQAVPLVATGAADRFGLDEREIALACASHSGEPVHEETARSMLRKIGLDASALKCGAHEPFSREAAQALRESGQAPHVLQNNCSGKHAGMLALALHLKAPTETYDQPDNPVQLSIARTVEQFSGVPLEDIAVGIDGCGVPVFGVTVQAMALSYVRLVVPPETPAKGFDSATRAACRRIVSAMTAHPELIGGPHERFDTVLMRAAGGRLISKIGAEGVYTAGILPCERWPRGLGLAFKIEDGEDRRARPTVVIEALRQLGVLDSEALETLVPYTTFPIHNHRGDTVGLIRPSFELELI
ncbi:MAG TPA: asparaginase [Pyrinomonadaceae bacterium]|jgi:L-asparaginase II